MHTLKFLFFPFLIGSFLFSLIGFALMENKSYDEHRELWCRPQKRDYVYTTVLDYGTYPFRISSCILSYKFKDRR